MMPGSIRAYSRAIGACLAAALVCAGCASQSPAPVTERAAPLTQIETPPASPEATPGSGTAAATGALPSGYYTVKKGDTLYSIALEHGQSYRDLANWNNLDNPNKIQIGQQLRIRMADAESAAPVAVARPVAAPTLVETRPSGGAQASAADSETLKREPKGGKLPYSEEALAKLQKADSASVIELKPESKPVPVEKAPDKPAAAADDVIEWVWPAGGKLISNFIEGSSKGLDIAGKSGEAVQAAASGKVILVSSALRGYGNFVIIKHNPAFLSVYAHNSRILVKEEQLVTKGQKIAEIGSSDSDQPKLHFEIRHQGKPVDPLKFLPAR